MANYLTTDTELTSIADAIRTKGGTSASLTYPSGFVSAIQNLPSGGSLTDITNEFTITSSHNNYTFSAFADNRFVYISGTIEATYGDLSIVCDNSNYYPYNQTNNIGEITVIDIGDWDGSVCNIISFDDYIPHGWYFDDYENDRYFFSAYPYVTLN